MDWVIKITQSPNPMYARLPPLADCVHFLQVLVIVGLTPPEDLVCGVASEDKLNAHILVTGDDAGSFIQKHFIADDRHNLPPSFDEDYIKEITIFIPFIHFNNIRLKYMNLR